MGFSENFFPLSIEIYGIVIELCILSNITFLLLLTSIFLFNPSANLNRHVQLIL
jgi:hypothetical protein